MTGNEQSEKEQVAQEPAVKREQTAVAPLMLGERGIELSSVGDVVRFGRLVVASGLAPAGLKTPEAVAVVTLKGRELGLTPMQSLESIGVINGRPRLYGSLPLALVRQSGELEQYTQTVAGECEARKAVVVVKRKGFDAIEATFSLADAKRAGLLGKGGPWQQYPDRMLISRARGFALQDAFGDVLGGMSADDEGEHVMADTPRPREVRPAIDAVAVEGESVNPFIGGR